MRYAELSGIFFPVPMFFFVFFSIVFEKMKCDELLLGSKHKKKIITYRRSEIYLKSIVRHAL